MATPIPGRTCYFLFIHFFLLSSFFVSESIATPLPYTTKYFDQYLDHFNFESYGANSQQTFKQRFLYQDEFWDRNTGPIFFYTGNEGAIDAFYNASGYIIELAQKQKALIVFAEHRFYGASLPFGTKDSFARDRVGLLNSQQALADYAVLVDHIRKQLNSSAPVIAFGGSYGGMLAAYIRFKYPNLVAGALAASAPIYLVAGLTPRNKFMEAVTIDYAEAESGCAVKVKTGFNQIQEAVSKKQFASLSAMFGVCEGNLAEGSVDHFLRWIRNAFIVMAMVDYPYPADFIANLPAYPVNVSCYQMRTVAPEIAGLVQITDMFYGHFGPDKCHNIFREFVDCADPTSCGLGTDARAWDYQVCTEIDMTGGSNGVTDMFPILPWTPDMRRDYCRKKWGVVPRPDYYRIFMWGEDIKSASNIIFSNGNLDPWSVGGVHKNISNSLLAIDIQGAAHHLDLRGSNPKDPDSVVKAREKEAQIIQGWVQQANRQRRTTS